VQQHPGLRLQLVVGASALLDRFGSVVDVIESDGFKPDARVAMIVEGETPATMAKSTGLGLLELPTIFDMLKPDIVVSVGDRFETMSTAIAAAYMNIPVAHTMGGEISGTIDESIRHAVTKLAHLHFPANEAAADRIIRMGEPPDTVHVVGCPRIDLVAEIAHASDGIPHAEWLNKEGVGAELDPSKPFLLVNQHPVTTEYGHGKEQIRETLEALDELKIPTMMLWPNVDAGSEDIATGMRTFREQRKPDYIRFYKNFPIETYIRPDALVLLRRRQLERADPRRGVSRRARGEHRHAPDGARPRAERHRRRLQPARDCCGRPSPARAWSLRAGSSLRRRRRRSPHRSPARARAAERAETTGFHATRVSPLR
jgi:UDP-hydrolysing UDP-N-acetyl-D-glucosamine 2-epimerase